MGSGGLRGLQNRCFGAEASKGWFDSDTPPPRKAEGRRQKAEVLALHDARGTAEHFCPLPSAFCLIVWVRPSKTRSSSLRLRAPRPSLPLRDRTASDPRS